MSKLICRMLYKEGEYFIMDYHFDYFYKKGTKLNIKKNTSIYDSYNKDAEPYVYLLESGLMALSSLTKDGSEKIYLYFTPRRLIGFNQFLSASALTLAMPIFITAKAQCIVYRLSGEHFMKLMQEDANFIDYVMRLNAGNYIEILTRFHEMQETQAGIRLFRFILTYSIRDEGRLILPKYFTYGEISKFLGIHHVTVNRIMAKLKKYGYIKSDGNSRRIVILNEKGLEKLIHSDVNLDY